MILQRRKAQHAALVSYEQETGGSDPLLPEFWEEDLSALEREERALLQEIEMAEAAEVEALAARAAETASGVSGASPTSPHLNTNTIGLQLNGTSAASLSGFAPGSYSTNGGGSSAAHEQAHEQAMRALEQCGEYEAYCYDDWENDLDEVDEAEIEAMEAAAREAERVAAMGVGFGAPGYIPPTLPAGAGFGAAGGFGGGDGIGTAGEGAGGEGMDVD